METPVGGAQYKQSNINRENYIIIIDSKTDGQTYKLKNKHTNRHMNKRKNRQKTDEQSNLMMDNFIEKLEDKRKDNQIIHVSIFHVKINVRIIEMTWNDLEIKCRKSLPLKSLWELMGLIKKSNLPLKTLILALRTLS